MWRRYRSSVGWAVLISGGVGVLCGLAVYLGGNADYRSQSGWGGIAYWVALGALFGIGTGAAAIVGGAVAIVLRDRSLSRGGSSRVALGVAGASIGSALLWGVLGAVTAATGGAGYSLIFIGVAAVAALLTAILARTILSRAERRQDGDVVEFRSDPTSGGKK